MRSGIPWDGAGETAFCAAVVAQREGDIGPRQRHAAQDLVAMRKFGGLGLEELAPCRGIEIQVGDLDHGATGKGRRFHSVGVAAQAEGMGLRSVVAGDRHAGYRRNGSQRLAAKAVAGYPFQVGQTAYLARGVARQRRRQIVGGDAAAVIDDANQAHTAFFQLHVDPGCGCVQAVFQQFLEHRSRTIDHLASGDLADEEFRQRLDDSHRGGIIASGKIASFPA